MISLTENEIQIIKDILKKHIKYGKAYLFGSRVKGTNKKFSDIDIVIDINIKLSLNEISRIKDDFEESDLIYSADIIDYNAIDDSFKIIIDNEKVLIYETI
ncbi:DNA polymerase subunit beta [Brachyspira hampsonii]|uniref:DNA polymerase subunit beta n=1 Tax=Brachyspira hampsonii TaxID=1287055 RepID=A0A1E5NAM2_9SPIR|nr:nucleotidyltransferase domain-containing protein [Brachyspira hampsonii]OEJ13151.1 DNA polymerase subunit beta [Brachyspira hampsonii]